MSGCFLGIARLRSEAGASVRLTDRRASKRRGAPSSTDQAGYSRPGTPAGERGASEELALASKHSVVHIETLDGCVTHPIQGQDAQIVGAPGEMRVPLVRPRGEQPMLATEDHRLTCHEIGLEAVAVGARGCKVSQGCQLVSEQGGYTP